MKKILILPSFERSVKFLSMKERKQLAKSLEVFNNFVLTGKTSSGLRFKKINHDKYEFRVTIRLRIIVKGEGDVFYLVLVGSHDQVKKYLKNFR